MSPATADRPQIWWANALFFLGVHVAALFGLYWHPYRTTPRSTLILTYFTWQLAQLGITIGYHRMYSHRAFRATLGVRVILAILGSSAFQGSIKWWSLRHRLHHRFTDDPIHDPYAATKGLFFSHMGWIFFKPSYAKLESVDRDDLDSDPVVRLQHEYYVPAALLCGFVLPTLIGSLWGDAAGAFVWAGLISRITIWHTTFLVNSLAHWEGLQPFSDEDTSRGNLVLAVLTSGEGSHNFHVSGSMPFSLFDTLTILQHTFPHDFRSGPALSAWDPSKWIIMVLHHFGLVYGLRYARDEDIKDALDYMAGKAMPYGDGTFGDENVETWSMEQVEAYARDHGSECILVISGLVVNATPYLGEHPGGARLLRKYAVHPGHDASDATWAFEGGLNNHSRAARKKLRSLAIAKVPVEVE